MKLKVGATALMVGVFAALVHTVWSLLVFLGMAKTYLDWMLGLHFLNNPFKVAAFSLTTAVTLVVVTFLIGYVIGWVFAFVWNKLHKG